MSSVLDNRSRPLRDLRISVTDRCNFRCTYCMPKEIFGRDFTFLPRDEQLATQVRSIWAHRADRYSELRHVVSERTPKIEMSYIGG